LIIELDLIPHERDARGSLPISKQVERDARSLLSPDFPHDFVYAQSADILHSVISSDPDNTVALAHPPILGSRSARNYALNLDLAIVLREDDPDPAKLQLHGYGKFGHPFGSEVLSVRVVALAYGSQKYLVRRLFF
jgi:hypothetical protein